MYASLVNKKAKIFHFRLKELVLLQISVQLGSSKVFNDKLQVLYMFFLIGGEDKDVVQVDYAKNVNISIESVVNVGLERGRGIS